MLLVGGADGPVGRRIADALETALSDRYRLERGELGAAAEGYFSAAIAVGLEAAERAARELAVPVVYCRVFDVERIRAIRPRLYGVAALPPLQMQLEAWQRLAPSGSTVGMIVSDGHRALVNAAREAAQARGLELEAAFARSDRELLYRFKRLVPHIDALWLFPDNEILSPGVVRETLDYAREHGVHSIVFTASLLEWGALISVESRADDVAANVAGVLADVTAGAAPPPAMTPLSRARVRVNDEVAAELGLRVRVSARETGVH